MLVCVYESSVTWYVSCETWAAEFVMTAAQRNVQTSPQPPLVHNLNTKRKQSCRGLSPSTCTCFLGLKHNRKNLKSQWSFMCGCRTCQIPRSEFCIKCSWWNCNSVTSKLRAVSPPPRLVWTFSLLTFCQINRGGLDRWFVPFEVFKPFWISWDFRTNRRKLKSH